MQAHRKIGYIRIAHGDYLNHFIVHRLENMRLGSKFEINDNKKTLAGQLGLVLPIHFSSTTYPHCIDV